MQLHHAAAIMDAACLTQRSQKYGLDEALFNINAHQIQIPFY